MFGRTQTFVGPDHSSPIFFGPISMSFCEGDPLHPVPFADHGLPASDLRRDPFPLHNIIDPRSTVFNVVSIAQDRSKNCKRLPPLLLELPERSSERSLVDLGFSWGPRDRSNQTCFRVSLRYSPDRCSINSDRKSNFLSWNSGIDRHLNQLSLIIGYTCIFYHG